MTQKIKSKANSGQDVGLWNPLPTEVGPKDLIALLAGVSIFADLDELELAMVERITYRRRFLPREVIFYENEPGVGIYVVLSGDVRIVLEHDSGDISTAEEVARLGHGEFFGEIALLDESPRTASAVAGENGTELVGLFRPDLLDLIDRAPKTGLHILKALGRIMTERLMVTHKTLQDRTGILKNMGKLQ